MSVLESKYIFLNNKAVHMLREGKKSAALTLFRRTMDAIMNDIHSSKASCVRTVHGGAAVYCYHSSRRLPQESIDLPKARESSALTQTSVPNEQNATPVEHSTGDNSAEVSGPLRNRRHDGRHHPFIARQAIMMKKTTVGKKNIIMVLAYNHALAHQVHSDTLLQTSDELLFSRYKAVRLYNLSLRLVTRNQDSPTTPSLLEICIYNNMGVLHSQLGNTHYARSILAKLSKSLVQKQTKDHDKFVSNIRLMHPESLLAAAA